MFVKIFLSFGRKQLSNPPTPFTINLKLPIEFLGGWKQKIDMGRPDPYNTIRTYGVQISFGKRGIYGNQDRSGEEIIRPLGERAELIRVRDYDPRGGSEF